jgi:L,D-transpeptidase catalytic domain/Putative peptidoglycan binding domain
MPAPRPLLTALVAALVVPTAAQAAEPTGHAGAERAAGHLSLRLEPQLRISGKRYAWAGRPIAVRGTVTPAVAGQSVILRLYRNGHKALVKRVRVRADGTVRASFRSGAGLVLIRGEHRRTSAQDRFRARSRRLTVLPNAAPAGARGPAVRWLQGRLARLHYAVPRSGVMDGGTQRAVMAYRKVLRLGRSFSADGTVFARLRRGAGAYRLRHPEAAGRHVEADLSRQVVVLAVGSRVHRIYHTSSGAPVTPTIRGTFRFYRKQPGTNQKGMVDSVFFIRGYAIHGYASVPPYNASHGCLRIPIPNARYVMNWLSLGDRIDVYAS